MARARLYHNPARRSLVAEADFWERADLQARSEGLSVGVMIQAVVTRYLQSADAKAAAESGSLRKQGPALLYPEEEKKQP